MPLLEICGLPCSGKSTRVLQLQEWFSEHYNKTVSVISDHQLNIDRNETYSDPKKEKELRGNLKSAVQRNVNKSDVLILDSMNYIKGFRYELFCSVKGVQTTQCVLFCDVSSDQALAWNEQRPVEDRYSTDVLEGLVARFERPESRNRWDSPLITVNEGELPFQQIYDTLYNKAAPPPNQATLSLPLSATNFLHELDKTTQAIVAELMSAQKSSMPGDLIPVPGSEEKIRFYRNVTLAELNRTRRQFISFTKTHPVDAQTRLGTMFVQYLNNCIS